MARAHGFGRHLYSRVRASSTDQIRSLAKKERAEQRRKLMERFDPRGLDIFGYHPDYTFPGYRSRCGALVTLTLGVAVLLRMVTLTFDFINPIAKISENKLFFPRDMATPYELPNFGLVFKKTGWKPFYDPTYFTFRFRQGVSGRASNSTYTELGDRPCSFIDTHGRIIEDEARCPDLKGQVVGNFFDDQFRFIHAAIVRCHNGTDVMNRPQPGPCRRPDEMDKIVYEGTISLVIAQHDLDVGTLQEISRLVTLKKNFKVGWHASYDVFFTMRRVTVQPRAFFDSLDEASVREFVVYDRTEVSFTDFRPMRLGRWNKADPHYVPQYGAFFLMLGEEMIDQQRDYISFFELVESWGGSICFFYYLFRTIAYRWNRNHFLQHVKGLDLRDISRDQFDQFGRLTDKSFQIPRELQDMDVVANGGRGA